MNNTWKLVATNVHLLSLAGAIGSTLVAEHFILQRVLFPIKPFSTDLYAMVRIVSWITTLALIGLWASGAGFIWLGYQDSFAYVYNEKIWAKVTIVLALTLNGIYIHRKLLPRLYEVSNGGAFINNSTESALFRLSVCISSVGWLMATFYGTAKFLNSYQYLSLIIPYLVIVAELWMFSYVLYSDTTNVNWRQKRTMLMLTNQIEVPVYEKK